MKKGNIKVENTGLNGTKTKSGFCTCEWLTGFIFLAVASGVKVAVLPFCELVVLSTCTSIGIVFNQVLSVICLGEKVVCMYDVTSVSLIVAGSLVIVFLSSYQKTSYTPDDIHTLIFSTTTFVFAIMAMAFFILTVA